MQERKHTRRMRHRIRKRVLFAMAFLGFSTLFYQSVRSFEQDHAIAAGYAPRPGDAVAPAAPDTVSAPARDTGLQGPVAIGLAFRINGNPGLHAQLARLRDRDSTDDGTGPVILPALVSRR